MASSDVLDVFEDFRLFLVSFWSDAYVWQAELTSEKLLATLASSFERAWLLFSRQSISTQMFFIIVFLFWAALAVTKLVMVVTSGVCKSKKKLHGKTALVTGANAGIGFETAKDLAARGARVILACRNMTKGIKACREIAEATGNTNVEVKRLDLSSMAVVRQFAREVLEEERRLDILVLNAGVALTQKYMTEDGLELHMASNHFGHFLLANILMDRMMDTAAKGDFVGRVVALSSLGHWWGKVELDNMNSERGYDSSRIYGTTKLCNLLFAKELSRRLKLRKARVVANAVHPGAVQTELFRNIPFAGPIISWATGLLFKTSKMGAQTSIFCAVDDSVASVSGKYFSDCRVAKCSSEANDPKLARQLWDRSAEILQMEEEEVFM